MSIKIKGYAIEWQTFFGVQNEKEKEQLIKRITETKFWCTYTSKELTDKMLEISGMKYSDYRDRDENLSCIQAACEKVAFKFMLCDSDFAKDFLDEEELLKAKEVYIRKQYNSKLLQQKLLPIFVNLLKEPDLEIKLNNIFTISIIDEFCNIQEDKINLTYGTLKKTIEKVASGVKSNCYYEAEYSYKNYKVILNESLNELFIKKANYDFNKSNEQYRTSNGRSTLFLGYENQVNNDILQSSLVEDGDFWENHKEFCVITFINKIAEFNDIRHAEKVLDFIIENLQKKQYINIVFSNNFPLYMSKYDELVKRLEDQAFRFSFTRLESYCDLAKIKNISLCYPMSKTKKDFFEIGKNVWNNFICKYNYPKDYKVVQDYLTKEVERFVSGDTCEYNDIAIILDSAPFRYSADNEDRRLFKAYHNDCFSSENIWNRVYLKAYAVTLLSSNEQDQFSYLQRIFIDLIKSIERRIGICTVHQLDELTRIKNYEKLKKMLMSYDVKINDEHRNDYIISLLDRDTALVEESELFPVLEQIGDAIYGLAVAELLFYNPNTKSMAKNFEKFTRAETQVFISKKLKFDKLYLQIGLPAKYVEYDTLFYDDENFELEKFQNFNKEKYLADSLEMIIGSIYRDLGFEKAIDFSKQLLLKTFSEQLKVEIRPTDENKKNINIDKGYWSKILPSPCSIMNSELRVLWDALNKVILIGSIGTDDKDKRRYITYNLVNTAIYGEEQNYGVTWVFYDYLNNGLTFVLKKYSDIIRNNYEKNKKF